MTWRTDDRAALSADCLKPSLRIDRYCNTAYSLRRTVSARPVALLAACAGTQMLDTESVTADLHAVWFGQAGDGAADGSSLVPLVGTVRRSRTRRICRPGVAFQYPRRSGSELGETDSGGARHRSVRARTLAPRYSAVLPHRKWQIRDTGTNSATCAFAHRVVHFTFGPIAKEAVDPNAATGAPPPMNATETN